MSVGAGRGLLQSGVHALSVRAIAEWAPRLPEVLSEMGISVTGQEDASLAFLCEEAGVDAERVLDALARPPRADGDVQRIEQLDILAGTSKDGEREPVERLSVRAGQAIAIVGATGSGKSQLLADVESLAQGDSLSGRIIHIDGHAPDPELTGSPANRPVAQISQSMHFLLDIEVAEFIDMHASSRGSTSSRALRAAVIEAACSLCGESFLDSTPLALLSGGQSRALMIADAALVGRAPIVVVDEIENAGIDRQEALAFLAGHGAITLLATHDPLLALAADARVIVRNGAMQEVLQRSGEETSALAWLREREVEARRLREALRTGQRLPTPGDL
jgi:ABC-type lipoprotein export system ATPase subunit